LIAAPGKAFKEMEEDGDLTQSRWHQEITCLVCGKPMADSYLCTSFIFLCSGTLLRFAFYHQI